VTLNGGDPRTLSLRRFLDAAYVCLVESYQAAGMNLIEALESTAEYRAGGVKKDAPPPTEAAVARQNERSLAELQKLMPR